MVNVSESKLIHAAAVVTMNDSNEIFSPGFVRLNGSTILEVGSGSPSARPGELLQDFRDDIVLPGFVNTHHHIASSLLQGVDPSHLMQVGTVRDGSWLKMSIAFDEQQCLAGASLGYVQLLQSGVTTTTDSQSAWRGLFKLDGSLKAAQKSGLRVVFTAAFSNKTELIPKEYQLSISQAIHELNRLRDAYQTDRVKIEPEPLSLPRVTDELVIALFRERNSLMAMHSTYSAEFDLWSRTEYGHPAIVHLEKLGVLDDSLLLAHPVHFDEDEIALLAKSGSAASYCAVSNMHMGLALPDLTLFFSAGITVGLGLDHPNGSHDFYETMKTTLLTQRSLKRNQEVMSPMRVLEMATKDGARALKIDRLVGSLEPGKIADLQVIDGLSLQMQPAAGVVSQIVTAAKAQCVKHVMIDGVWHLSNYQPVFLNIQEITNQANAEQKYLLNMAGLPSGDRNTR